MIIRLQTRCGCVRLVERPNGWLDEFIEMAIMKDVTMCDLNGENKEVGLWKRRFRFRGQDADGTFIYFEEL